MKYRVDKVNSWNGWDPLKQVILGNVFEPKFFRDIPDLQLRDLLTQLLESEIYYLRSNLNVQNKFIC